MNVLQDFKGVVRLFPLPNLVLFPHVVQPLHVFEPRYRQMTKDALESDRFIAMVLLKPGWEEDYEGHPEVHDVACLGRIFSEELLPQGKYNLQLGGLCRLRIEKEIPSDHPYRLAHGWPVPDPPNFELPELKGTLVETVKSWLPHAEFMKDFTRLIESPLPLGALCDVLSFMLPLPTQEKQSLLEELDIDQRTRALVRLIQSAPAPELLPPPRERQYPPPFSTN